MKCLLVLQWSASSSEDYDAMIEVENALIEKLSKDHDVDGHDAGSGEMNIFIRTEDPKQAFTEAKTILGSGDFWVNARVAYREIDGNNYTILWPKNLSEFNVV